MIRFPITAAARYLDAAVSAHLTGNKGEAQRLIRLADIPVIREWTESLWGRSHVIARPAAVLTHVLPKEQRVPARKPSTEQIHGLHQRDGYHCRFCGFQ